MRTPLMRVLVMVGLAACGAAVPPVPGKGGPPWFELTSPHFTVWTDADPVRVREVVNKMERLHVILVNAVFSTAPTGSRTLAIVLRDDAELRAFSATGEARAFADPAQFPLWQPMIVLSASSNRPDIEVSFAHELVHAISFGVIHHQPRWFAEGLATYFQTVGLDSRLETVEIGGSPFGRKVDIDRLLPIAELFRWTKATIDEQQQYLSAWALFLFLMNQHPAELQRYMRLLDRAGGEIRQQPDLARRIWDVAFPTLPFNEVDRARSDWVFNAKSPLAVSRFRLGEWNPSITGGRRLGDADVYAIRALLRTGTDKAQAHAAADAALAAEPTQVTARLLAASLAERSITADEARAMTGAHEDDWRAWMIAASVSGNAEEAGAARTRACELAAANPALSPPPDLCPRRREPPSSP